MDKSTQNGPLHTEVDLPREAEPAPVRRHFRRMEETLATHLLAEWKQADHSDNLVRVWDLERIRQVKGGK